MIPLLDIGQIGFGDDEFLLQLPQSLLLLIQFAALPLHQLHQLGVMDVAGSARRGRSVLKFLPRNEIVK